MPGRLAVAMTMRLKGLASEPVTFNDGCGRPWVQRPGSDHTRPAMAPPIATLSIDSATEARTESAETAPS